MRIQKHNVTRKRNTKIELFKLSVLVPYHPSYQLHALVDADFGNANLRIFAVDFERPVFALKTALAKTSNAFHESPATIKLAAPTRSMRLFGSKTENFSRQISKVEKVKEYLVFCK